MGQWLSTLSPAVASTGRAPRRRPRDAAPEPAARQLSIQDLPDSLLGHILALAALEQSPRDRVALTLVCHRWNEVLCSPCAAPLWRTFSLAEQQWRPMDVDTLYGAKHRLLQAVAPAVHTLEFHRGSVELAEKSCATVPQFLAACDPAVLRCVMLRCQEPPPRRVLAALQRAFPALHELELHGVRLQRSALALLRHLALLRCLHFCAYHAFPDGLLDAVLSLKTLNKLGLVCNEALPSDCGRLTELTALTALTLMQEPADWAPPSPATFPALEVYLFESQRGGLQLGGATLQRCQLTLVEGGSGSTAAKDVPASSGGSSRKQLSIEGEHLSVPSLQALLDAALPPGPPLHALVLFHGTIESAATAGTSSLAGLHTLTLQQICKPADGSLAALLSVAPQLRNLQLRWLDYESRQDSLPDSVTALTSLTRLERKADNNGVSWDLPAGPYLTGLRELVLFGCSLTAIPAAVRAAMQLTTLDLRHNPLQRLDVSLLRRLPDLRQIGVDWQLGGGIDQALDQLLGKRRALQRLPSKYR